MGILLPFIPIVTTMSKFAADAGEIAGNNMSATQLFLSEGLGYSLPIFPDFVCLDKTNTSFYTWNIPAYICLGVCCSLLLAIFWSICKVSFMLRRKASKKVNNKIKNFM